MMLAALLSPFEYKVISGVEDSWPSISLLGCCDDSRQLQQGEVFFAYPGRGYDGRDYLSQALCKGPAAIIMQSYSDINVAREENNSLQNCFEQCESLKIPLISIDDLSDKVAFIARDFYGDPGSKMMVIGVTGTNGKTSVAAWVASSLSFLGHKCAMIGTLGVGFANTMQKTGLTTPGPVAIQKYLASLLSQGASHVVMEVSSHALDQGRVIAVPFKVAALTQLGSDHLDYHKDIAHYREAKAKLFAMPGLQSLVLNVGDSWGRSLYNNYQALDSELKLIGYKLDTTVSCVDDVVKDASDLDNSNAGYYPILHACYLDISAGASIAANNPYLSKAIFFNTNLEKIIELQVIADFNLENLLAVAGILVACGVSYNVALDSLSKCYPALGRMQCFIASGKPLAVVDYAHTAAALEKVLIELCRCNKGNLFVVFGCGGQRDKSKRPQMAKVACQYADFIIFTNDNPRSESPEAIVADMMRGVDAASRQRVSVCYDRAQAIADTIKQADVGDVVLIAGKGHETTQIIGDKSIVFSDLKFLEDIYC